MRAPAVGIVLATAALAIAVAAQQPTDTTRRGSPTDSGRVEGLRRPPASDAPPRAERRGRGERPDGLRSAVGAADRLRFGGRRFVQADFDRSGAQGWMSVASIAPGVNVANVVVTRGGARIPLRLLTMTGAGGRCTPTIFLDDARTPMVESDWDLFIALDKLEAIEVYSAAAAPPMFRGFEGNCGSVALWTRADAR